MKEGIKGRENMWLSSIPNVQCKQNFCGGGWLVIGSACQDGEQLLSLLGSLIAQVMERAFCIYSTVLLWARESGPGVRLGQGGWRVISSNPERVSSNIWSCMVEVRVRAALTHGYFIVCPSGGNCNSQPAGRIVSWLFQIFFPLTSILIGSHCSPLIFFSSPFPWPPCPELDLPPCHTWLVLAQVIQLWGSLMHLVR